MQLDTKKNNNSLKINYRIGHTLNIVNKPVIKIIEEKEIK